MLDKFFPDLYFNSFLDVTPDLLQSLGITSLMIDIDNTIAPYELAEPNEEILTWLKSLRGAGIGFAFISNNTSRARIDKFNKNIGAPAYARSGKPFAQKSVRHALASLGASAESCAFMGDQIFTDICAGKLCGMRTILVPPIKDKKNLLFKIKRGLERPIMRSFFKKRGQNTQINEKEKI